MNSYEKAKAQIEQKKLHKKYEVWVYPQSDLGVKVLTEPGFFAEYKLYYDDQNETEADRIAAAKDIAHQALANKFDRFSHRNVSAKKYAVDLTPGTPRGYLPDLAEGHDYAMQVTEIPVEEEAHLSFDDIQALGSKVKSK